MQLYLYPVFEVRVGILEANALRNGTFLGFFWIAVWWFYLHFYYSLVGSRVTNGTDSMLGHLTTVVIRTMFMQEHFLPLLRIDQAESRG